jgi:hypothetical protein
MAVDFPRTFFQNLTGKQPRQSNLWTDVMAKRAKHQKTATMQVLPSPPRANGKAARISYS